MVTLEILDAGVQATVQTLHGRRGYWGVGLPPSGAWDTTSFGLANLAVGNEPAAAGMEWVVAGPTLRFADRRLVCVTGASPKAILDGCPLGLGVVGVAGPGSVLATGMTGERGMRGYVAISGGLDVPVDLGSRSTFLLGDVGGHHGRALVVGDVLPLGRQENGSAPRDVSDALPDLLHTWHLRVIAGPHGAPEHLTVDGVEELFAATWVMDHRSDRTGVRLLGPTPGWARTDGGEAGLHPSNIHDSAYPVGGIMLAGDTPVIVGPDGPSLGGFVVPAAVIGADLWKLGQLRPGDQVILQRVSLEQAAAPGDRVPSTSARAKEDLGAAHLPVCSTVSKDTVPKDTVAKDSLSKSTVTIGTVSTDTVPKEARSVRLEPLVEVKAQGVAATIRASGDRHLLVQAGDPVLDLRVRMWVGLLEQAVNGRRVRGVTELVAGVRSLLVGFDPSVVSMSALAETIGALVETLGDPDETELACREVVLPIAFDHPLAHEAMARYSRSVRPDAPWCPDNVEFIRRVNDLDARDDVFDIVAAATYLVLGLGDVYLGAPVAVPIDPRHRLVTTKYSPARTWTPQNAVGIGGVYLCVYGMEGPGGYQLVGRTVPVWRHLGIDETPWLLRHFDRLRFRPVSAEELADLRADIVAGRANLDTRPSTFSLKEVAKIEAAHRIEIAEITQRRNTAFVAERARWQAS
jgi:urea carboxylase